VARITSSISHRARSERSHDLLALALADFGQRLRRAVLVGGGKL